METTLKLEVVTPVGTVLSLDVDEVVAPGENGEFGVLPGHLPLLASVDTGILHYRVGTKTTDVAVGTGFAEILNDRALIITEKFITVDEVAAVELETREALQKLDRELETWEGELDDPKRMAMVEEEQWLATKLHLMGDESVAKLLIRAPRSAYEGLIPVKDPDASAPAVGGADGSASKSAND